MTNRAASTLLAPGMKEGEVMVLVNDEEDARLSLDGEWNGEGEPSRAVRIFSFVSPYYPTMISDVVTQAP